MADLWTPFRPVYGGENGTVKNQLPNKTAADAFQYRKVLGRVYSPDSLPPNSDGATLSGKFKFRIRENASKSGTQNVGRILFEQEIQIRVLITLQISFGTVNFFSWSPMDTADAFQKVTTICDGETVPIGPDGKTQGWKYVDTATPTIYSEQGDVRAGDFDDVTDDLTATSIYTDKGGRIDATYQSPRYRCKVPVGAMWEFISDDWGDDSARAIIYSFSFRGQPSFSGLVDWTNAFRCAEPRGGGIYQGYRYLRSGRTFGPQHVRSFMAGVNQACITKTADNALYMAGLEGTVARLWISEDDGTTMRKVTLAGSTGEETDVTVFSTGFTLLDLKSDAAGQLHALGQRDDVLYLSSDIDNWNAVRKVGPVRNGGVYRLGIGHDGSLIVGSAGHEWIVEGNGMPYERPAQAGTTGGTL